MNTLPHKGFTLIELMIVVAIVGILAAIAYPAYRDQVQKSHRADGKTALLGAVQLAERFFTQNGTYVGATIPANSDEGYYNLTYAATASTFTVTATPDPAGPQATDPCGVLTINQANVKTDGGGTDCW